VNATPKRQQATGMPSASILTDIKSAVERGSKELVKVLPEQSGKEGDVAV
jgi:hypothetical protein